MGMSVYQNCVLALLMNGDNGSKFFNDERMHPVTVYNNAALSTTKSIFGGSSAYFAGMYDRIMLPFDAAWGFGTRDFCISCWVYPTNTGANQSVIDARISDTTIPWLLGINSTGLARSYDGTTVRTGGQLTFNIWNHLEWDRANNVNYIFANGVYGHGWSATQDFGTSKGLSIGSNILAGAEQTIGYVDEVLIFNKALNTSGFTPPASSLAIDTAAHRASGLILPRHNPDLNGPGTLTGYTRVQTGPSTYTAMGNCVVSLFDAKTKRIVAQTVSAADGTYTFTGINPARNYYANAFDPTGTYDVTATSNLQIT
jgi:hypothetical protein